MDCQNRLLAIWIILIALFALTASSKVDIDYTHLVMGTGTVMTDYRMGDPDESEASGVVRGTGEVMNDYYFSTNNSSDLRVEDKFVLTNITEKVVTKSVSPRFPEWPGGHGSYRLIGKSWAEKIEVTSHSNPLLDANN
jgi:hypothetical protein